MISLNSAMVLFALGGSLMACGGETPPETAAAPAGETLAAQSSPTPPEAGEWMIKGWKHGFVEPDSPFWIDDIHLVSGKSQTFSGTMGCGLSNCSGHEITGVKGTWKVHGSASAPRIDFTFSKQTQTYSYEPLANQGGPSALLFTLQNDIFGKAGPFTMYLVAQ